jgi:hypothetical protein
MRAVPTQTTIGIMLDMFTHVVLVHPSPGLRVRFPVSQKKNLLKFVLLRRAVKAARGEVRPLEIP